VTANGIQVFAGREGNNDWATPDFTLLPSVPDDVAKMGLPFAAWVNVVGFNEFNSTVNMSASLNAENAPIMFDEYQLTIDGAGTCDCRYNEPHQWRVSAYRDRFFKRRC
jgi:hypothetical protein